jgi:hypothetical protein
MPTVLSDPAPVYLVVYALAAMIALAVWYQRRDPKSRNAMIGVVSIVALLFFFNFWFESPREKAIGRVHGVIAAMNQYDSGLAVTHVSDRFDYRGAKKSDLSHALLNQILRDHRTVISAWGFSRSDVSYDESGNAVTVGFGVNVTGTLGSRPGFYVRATAVKDADGEWRINGFKVYENAMQQTNSPEFIVPGLGK